MDGLTAAAILTCGCLKCAQRNYSNSTHSGKTMRSGESSPSCDVLKMHETRID